MRFPSDVPVHRPSVGAMGLASGNQMPRTIRCYTYQGTGYDQYESPPPPPKPKPAPQTKRKRRRRRPEPPVYYPRYTPPDEPVYQYVPPPIPREPEPEPGYQTGDGNDGSVLRPLKSKPPRVSRNPRPSPGWQPTTGEDLEAWLEEL